MTKCNQLTSVSFKGLNSARVSKCNEDEDKELLQTESRLGGVSLRRVFRRDGNDVITTHALMPTHPTHQ